MPSHKLVFNIGYLVTVDSESRVLNNAWIAHADGFIEEIGTGPLPERAFAERVDAHGGILLPGLVNTHHHFYQTMARAYTPGNNQPLLPWLAAMNKLWVGHYTNEDLYLATQYALAELMLSGCTTAADHHYIVPKNSIEHHNAQFEAASEMGVRFHCGRGAMDKPSPELISPWLCQGYEQIMEDWERLLKDYHDPNPGSMYQTFLAPTAVTSCTETLLRDAASLAKKHQVPLHTHCGETIAEDEYALRHFGERQIPYLANLGWDFDRVYFAHGIHFTDEELTFLAKNRMGVAHCPYANMRLGSGICRVPELRAAGAKVGIGVDGSASNDSGHILGELRQAFMLARVKYGPDAMTALEAIEIGTQGGAEILGRTDIGSIEVG
ncbi:MAG: amidohydrolase family protein, partial [Verrucomicrobiota bacterium]